MGSVGFSTLVANVERNIGNNTSFTTQVQNAVNQAYLDILMMKIPRPGGGFYRPIDFAYGLHTSGTITVASGNQSFALTSVSGISSADDVLAVYGLRDTTNNWMLAGPKQFRELLEKDVSASGTPTDYSRYGNSIYFNFTTDASTNYTLYYYKRPAALSGTSTTDIPKEFDYAIELRATQIIFETPLQETDNATLYAQRLQEWLLSRIDVDELSAEDADFGLEPTRSARATTNRKYMRGRSFYR